MPAGLTYRGGKNCEKWLFNGADMDQGLFTHHFVINHGPAMLIDTELGTAKQYKKGMKRSTVVPVTLKDAFPSCAGQIPTRFFAHFTGRSKPWMTDLLDSSVVKPGSDMSKWRDLLDSLGLPINSTNIKDLKLGSPLGFFNANFPKGGYRKVKGIAPK